MKRKVLLHKSDKRKALSNVISRIESLLSKVIDSETSMNDERLAGVLPEEYQDRHINVLQSLVGNIYSGGALGGELGVLLAELLEIPIEVQESISAPYLQCEVKGDLLRVRDNILKYIFKPDDEVFMKNFSHGYNHIAILRHANTIAKGASSVGDIVDLWTFSGDVEFTYSESLSVLQFNHSLDPCSATCDILEPMPVGVEHKLAIKGTLTQSFEIRVLLKSGSTEQQLFSVSEAGDFDSVVNFYPDQEVWNSVVLSADTGEPAQISRLSISPSNYYSLSPGGGATEWTKQPEGTMTLQSRLYEDD